MQRAISQHFTVKTCKCQNGCYSATSLTAHHCLYYLLKFRLQVLGWGWHPALTSFWVLGQLMAFCADAYKELTLCQQCNVVISGLGAVCAIVVLSFCAIKINPVHMCPLLKSGRLPHYFVKSADCSTIAQKEEKNCLFEPL